MDVTTIAVRLKIDGENSIHALQEAGAKLAKTNGEMVLDFSSVRRIDASSLQQMKNLAEIAENRGVSLVLRDVNTDIYRVLKLVKLAPRFSFQAEIRERLESGHAAQRKP